MPDLVERAFKCMEPSVRQQLEDGFAFVRQALEHQAEAIKPEHGVAALIAEGAGAARNWFQTHGPGASRHVVKALLSYTPEGLPAEPILSAQRLTEELCSAELRQAFARIVETANGQAGVLDELHLLGALLLHVDQQVVDDFMRFGGVDLRKAGEALVGRRAVGEIEVFGDDGGVQISLFTARAWRALQVALREAEDMGNRKVTALSLWVSLLELPDSLLAATLAGMGRDHRRLLETSRELLKGTGPRRRTSLGLDRQNMDQSLVAALNGAARSAHTAGRELVGEGDLAAGVVGLRTGVVAGLVASLNLDVDELQMRLASAEEAGGDQQAQRLFFPPIDQVIRDLQAAIVGQEEVIEALVPYLKRIRFGLVRPHSPAGVFLFVGPTGTGKTEMARQLARSLYGSEEALIFIEMGQLTTSESCSILTGAPPGYVGYGEGKLTNGLRDHPESVVLFDEIEKAHPDVINVLLRFLDEGQVTDPAGPVRDGRRCLVVMTSNLLDDVDIPADGPVNRDALIAKLRKQAPFDRAEIFGRVDAVLFFRSLDQRRLAEIARRQLTDLQAQLGNDFGISLTIDEAAMRQLAGLIAAKTEELGQGARGVERVVTTIVLSPLIDFLDKAGAREVTLSVSEEGEAIEFR